MNWQHVRLIFRREMLDQLRDRRTLFTITILPLLLYPLLGMMMMQVAQFHRASAVKVVVLGGENWPKQLPLLDVNGEIALDSVTDELRRSISFDQQSVPRLVDDLEVYARELLKSDKIDAVVIVGKDFKDWLDGSSSPPSTADPSTETTAADNKSSQSSLVLVTNLARDQSSIAQTRVTRVIDRWWDSWRTQQMVQAGLAAELAKPIQLKISDTSVGAVRQAVRWSKILPFIMLVWALTGAFYPAVDLCAGEKERGTLETLLSSPA